MRGRLRHGCQGDGRPCFGTWCVTTTMADYENHEMVMATGKMRTADLRIFTDRTVD